MTTPSAKETTDLPKAVSPAVPKKFDRNARLWGGQGVEKLAHAHVMVLGMGGVGSFAVEGLARSGIGRLSLVDFDEVCITNVNRQLHALPSTVGKSKAVLMGERARVIHPGVQVEAIHEFYEARTSAAILARKPDVIVDCIDNVTAKLHLLATCIFRQIPMVTCLGASGKVDPTRVAYGELRKTHDDPLAKAIRKNLWRVYGINLKRVYNLMSVFSDETPIRPNPSYHSSLCGGECVCPNSGNPHHTCAERNIIYGSAVFVTSMFGMTATSLAVRFLVGELSSRAGGEQDAGAAGKPSTGTSEADRAACESTFSLTPTLKVLEGDEELKDPEDQTKKIQL